MIRCKATVRYSSLWNRFLPARFNSHITKKLCTLHNRKQKLLGDWHHIQTVFSLLGFCSCFCIQPLSEKREIQNNSEDLSTQGSCQHGDPTSLGRISPNKNKPIHPCTGIRIIQIVLFTFPLVQTRRICLKISSFLKW